MTSYNMLICGIFIFVVAILNFIFPKFFLKRGKSRWLYLDSDPSDSTIKATRIVTAIVALGSIAVIVIAVIALANGVYDLRGLTMKDLFI